MTRSVVMVSVTDQVRELEGKTAKRSQVAKAKLGVDYIERPVPGRPGAVERIYRGSDAWPETAPAALKATLTKPGFWDIETQVFARARPRYEVRFGRSGDEPLRTQIENEISLALQGVFRYRQDRENVEVGGYLAAWDGNDPQTLRWAIGSDPTRRREDGEKRSPNAVSLDYQHASDVAKAEGARIIGDWHTHPDRDGIPSEHDAKNWGRHAAAEGRGVWVSLIAYRGEGGLGWEDPRFRAWITVDKNDVRSCWPATIEGDE